MLLCFFLRIEFKILLSFLFEFLLNAVIQAILQSERAIETTNGTGLRGLRGQLNKVVLAYSGGLDTSVIVPWLR